MNGDNVKISNEDLDKIRSINNFDLIMFISEIDDHGFELAMILLEMIMDQEIYK